MELDIEGIHFFVGHFNTTFISFSDEMSIYGQASLGLGIADVMQNIVERPQGTTCPSLADLAKQAMFNRVPFGRPGWIVTDGNGQAKLVRYFFLQVPLPDSRAVAVTATTIRFDHQVRGLRPVF